MNEKELYQSAIQSSSNGDKEKAIEILTSIISTYPDSKEAENAKALRYNLKEGVNLGATSSASSTEISLTNTNIQKVVITDIQMTFWSMVVFMVKWAIAFIPAFIILFVLFSILIGMFGGIIGVSQY